MMKTTNLTHPIFSLLVAMLLMIAAPPPLVQANPGGVSSNLQLWLKADAGTSTTTDGSTLTSWTDQSPNGYSAINSAGDSQTEPTFRDNTSGNINFNPVVEFDGVANGLDLGSDYLYSSNDGLTFFAVVEDDDYTSSAYTYSGVEFILDFGSIADRGYGFAYSDYVVSMYTPMVNDEGTFSQTTHSYDAMPVIYTGQVAFGSQQTIYLNGTSVLSDSISLTQLTSSEINANVTHVSDGGPVTIGRQSKLRLFDEYRLFDGNMAEIILYDSNLPDTDRNKVLSYLALKYGITLNNSIDYVNSSGTVIYPSTSTHSGYTNDIAGIGVDSASGLNQLQSRSMNYYSDSSDNSIVTITGTSISDGNFLIWGNDNGSLSSTTEVPSTSPSPQRLIREWRVAETGDTGNVTISFDLSILGDISTNSALTFVLLTDTDGDFSDASLTSSASSSSNIVDFIDVNLNDGDYFSITYNHAPVASDVNITGPTVVGETLTGNYTYNDDDGDLEATSIFQWYYADDLACTINKTAISNATTQTYAPTASEVEKYICLELTPQASSGISIGTTVLTTTTNAIEKADQTISLNHLSDRERDDPPFTVNATTTSGLPVTFSASGNCTILDNTVTLYSTGSCSITVSQSGNNAYNPAPNVSRTFDITKPEKSVPTHQLTVTVTGSGIVNGVGINCGSDCNQPISQGDKVTLTATPLDNFSFESWGGDCDSDGEIQISSDATCTATFVSLCPDDGLIYVNQSATGNESGLDWNNALTDLQAALSRAQNSCTDIKEIWVAKGTYKPTTDTDRTATFQLRNGVAIYGGFSGNETQLSERNGAVNTTTLSGDIGTSNDNSDNSYHVVTGSGTDATALLDGVTISYGNANHEDNICPDACGGGIFNDNGSPTLKHLSIKENTAIFGGGVMNWQNSQPIIKESFISNNNATDGGGLMNDGSHPVISHVFVKDNTATNLGGGLFNTNSAIPLLSHVNLSGNSATTAGGGIANDNSKPVVSHSLLTKNTANNGGAMVNLNYSSATLSHVIISNNTTTQGGVIVNDNSNPLISQSTLVDNSSGIANLNSNPTVNNSILWNNGTPITDDVNSQTTVNYSIVQGGWTGKGSNNKDEDPLFVKVSDETTAHTAVEDFHLADDSPAIDAGNNDLIPLDLADAECMGGDGETREQVESDFDCKVRQADGDNDGTIVVDMGAFEASSIPLQTVTVTVTKAGNGSGTITSNLGGIDCGTDCEQEYSSDSVLILMAIPDTGSAFSGWSGDCDENQVVLDADKTCIATFLPGQALTVSVVGNGTVTADNLECSDNCTVSYPQNTIITLTTQPQVGWELESFSRDCDSTGYIQMTAAKNCTITFIENEEVANIPNNGDGNSDGIQDIAVPD